MNGMPINKFMNSAFNNFGQKRLKFRGIPRASPEIHCFKEIAIGNRTFVGKVVTGGNIMSTVQNRLNNISFKVKAHRIRNKF